MTIFTGGLRVDHGHGRSGNLNTFGPQYLRNDNAGFVKHLCYLRLLRHLVPIETESETIIVQILKPLDRAKSADYSELCLQITMGRRVLPSRTAADTQSIQHWRPSE